MAKKRSKKTARYRAMQDAAKAPADAVDRGTAADGGTAVDTTAVAVDTSGTAVAMSGMADASQTGMADFDATGTTGTTVVDEETVRVPVYEEELAANTRPAELGAVRIEKDVVVEQRQLDVPVTEERVRVVRHAVDREAPDDADAFVEGTIRVPVHGEAVELNRTVRVAEEVEIGKDAVKRTEVVSDTVRREEVRIEEVEHAAGASRGADEPAEDDEAARRRGPFGSGADS